MMKNTNAYIAITVLSIPLGLGLLLNVLLLGAFYNDEYFTFLSALALGIKAILLFSVELTIFYFVYKSNWFKSTLNLMKK